MDKNKKKISIIAISSIVLVAMVVILVVACTGGTEEKVPEVSASQRAIMTICDTTDYQQACLDSLAGHNSSDPKELIGVAFQASINYIKEAAKNSSIFRKVEKEPRAKSALETCQEVMNRAVDDLQRSYNKFTSFDITYVEDILLDLKIWLSGAITHQETCLDAFQGVPGDDGNKAREALKKAMEMTSNALAMVAEISIFLEALGMQSSSSSSRRLLSESTIEDGEHFPEWLDSNRRKLLSATPQVVKPDLIVAKDGSGSYKTINEALKYIPKNGNKTFILYLKEGIYEEKVQFNSTMKHLFVIGDGPTKTIITGKLNFIDGTGTYHTATVAVQADDFIARDIGFENTAGPEKHQAVALRVSADKAIFYNCHMDAYQDTLYVHTYRQFYRNCKISGTIDFIFGDSASVFQNCTLSIRKPMENQQCIVTAQGRKEIRQPTGIVLQNCTIEASSELYPVRRRVNSYLGRPWKQYSRTVVMESFLDDVINPDGWLPWNATFALDTLFYTEFNNRGPAAPKKQRVKWAGVKELPSSRIHRFTAAEFLDGSRWIPLTQVPYTPGFIFPVPKEDPNVKYSAIVPEETKDLGSKVEKEVYFSPPKGSTQEKQHSSTPSSVPTSVNTMSSNPIPGKTTLVSPKVSPPPPPIPPSASTVVIVETPPKKLPVAASPKSSDHGIEDDIMPSAGNFSSVPEIDAHPPTSSERFSKSNATSSTSSFHSNIHAHPPISPKRFSKPNDKASPPTSRFSKSNSAASPLSLSLSKSNKPISPPTPRFSKSSEAASPLTATASVPTSDSLISRFGGNTPPTSPAKRSISPLSSPTHHSIWPLPSFDKTPPNDDSYSPPPQQNGTPPEPSVSGASNSNTSQGEANSPLASPTSGSTSPPSQSDEPKTTTHENTTSTKPVVDTKPPPPSSPTNTSTSPPNKDLDTPPTSSIGDLTTLPPLESPPSIMSTPPIPSTETSPPPTSSTLDTQHDTSNSPPPSSNEETEAEPETTATPPSPSIDDLTQLDTSPPPPTPSTDDSTQSKTTATPPTSSTDDSTQFNTSTTPASSNSMQLKITAPLAPPPNDGSTQSDTTSTPPTSSKDDSTQFNTPTNLQTPTSISSEQSQTTTSPTPPPNDESTHSETASPPSGTATQSDKTSTPPTPSSDTLNLSPPPSTQSEATSPPSGSATQSETTSTPPSPSSDSSNLSPPQSPPADGSLEASNQSPLSQPSSVANASMAME